MAETERRWVKALTTQERAASAPPSICPRPTRGPAHERVSVLRISGYRSPPRPSCPGGVAIDFVSGADHGDNLIVGIFPDEAEAYDDWDDGCG